MTDTARNRKLIEVALPLDEINAACKADKGRAHGTIKNLHKWFAPMPLPAWRALLFAALVDDPANDEKRAYLLDVIKRLVANGADVPDAVTIEEARKIIAEGFPAGVPPVMDPFCGGGSTLVEAQRLGLLAYGSDLNPVPALISRALIELVPRTCGRQPLHPQRTEAAPAELGLDPRLMAEPRRTYAHFDGIAADVRHYAESVQVAAATTLHPFMPAEPGEKVLGWLWCRTATCPNPACGAETLLATSWWLSKRDKHRAWIEPVVSGRHIGLALRQEMYSGEAPATPKIGDGVFACVVCDQILDGAHLRAEGKAGRLGLRMTAVIAEIDGRRKYRVPTPVDLDVAAAAKAALAATTDIPINVDGQGIRVGLYGMSTWNTLYTPRQLLVLSTLSDLVANTHQQVLDDGGSRDWADAVTTLLALGVGRLAQFSSSQARWTVRDNVSSFEGAFPRNDLPMTWDFYELNVFGDAGPSWSQTFTSILRALKNVVPDGRGRVALADARVASSPSPALVATDPPYFDAIGYADLSDYFYVWHRRCLKHVHPDLYATVAAPKAGELTAIPSHHGKSKTAARSYFIVGFTETFRNLRRSFASDLPMIVVYASKEQKGSSGETTRWSSILTAIVAADLEITGTWPILGTTDRRMVGQGTNAVATYVAMVCRPRRSTAGDCSLADFNRALRRELKPAVHDLQASGILPVDLAQAAMGPGMQVYSRYRQVLNQEGERVPVDQALRLINAALGEVLDEQEGELDPYSRFAVAWWERNRWEAAAFGQADQLARPQGIAVDDVVRAAVAHYPRPGFVQILGNGELDRGWSPASDSRPSAWETVHHLADRLIDGGGTLEAARLMARLGTYRDPAQALVYRLHDIAARKSWTKDQERYNALIGSWSDLLAVAATEGGKGVLF